MADFPVWMVAAHVMPALGIGGYGMLPPALITMEVSAPSPELARRHAAIVLGMCNRVPMVNEDGTMVFVHGEPCLPDG